MFLNDRSSELAERVARACALRAAAASITPGRVHVEAAVRWLATCRAVHRSTSASTTLSWHWHMPPLLRLCSYLCQKTEKNAVVHLYSTLAAQRGRLYVSGDEPSNGTRVVKEDFLLTLIGRADHWASTMASCPSAWSRKREEETAGDSFCRQTPAGGAPARGGGGALDARFSKEQEAEAHWEERSKGRGGTSAFLFSRNVF